MRIIHDPGIQLPEYQGSDDDDRINEVSFGKIVTPTPYYGRSPRKDEKPVNHKTRRRRKKASRKSDS